MTEQIIENTQNDDQNYYNTRIKELKIFGEKPYGKSYPHKFEVDTNIIQLLEKSKEIADGDKVTDKEYSIGCRILLKRNSGRKLFFYTVLLNGEEFQVICSENFHYDKESDSFQDIQSMLHRGDVVGFKGYLGKSKKGEPSLFATNTVLLSPCLHMLPKSFYGLSDVETRYKKRYLDMIINNNVRKTFETRSKVIKYMRNYLDNKDFIEVETPILNTTHGGASAKPFISYHNELDIEMYMRVAPELNLKKLVIGGMERVYEIGKQFRNEGVDPTHNPEFTSLEFYMAYADYYDLMTMSEELLSNLVKEITGSYQIKIKDGEKETDIDFTPPFRKVDMMKELKSHGIDIVDYESENTKEYLINYCQENNIKVSPPYTTARLLDKIVGHFIEPTCNSPTFIYNHPLVMSPLAKWHREDKNLSERFELFVNGFELCNAYTELNSPEQQNNQFLKQNKLSKEGDDEAQVLDKDFVTALEYGLPPTAGWGCGIDRLVMLLTNTVSIKEVILFPTIK